MDIERILKRQRQHNTALKAMLNPHTRQLCNLQKKFVLIDQIGENDEQPVKGPLLEDLESDRSSFCASLIGEGGGDFLCDINLADYVDMQLTNGVTEKHPYRGNRHRPGLKEYGSEKNTVNLETMRRMIETDRHSAPKLSSMKEHSRESDSKHNSKIGGTKFRKDDSTALRSPKKNTNVTAKTKQNRFGNKKLRSKSGGSNSDATNENVAGSQVCFS